ncbi:MAG: hypothetical protein PHI68_00510 [Candidatus Cloacimonetes bacterium]|nr:hypothetical protein [Candidatus Cloacimonadota bacterium]
MENLIILVLILAIIGLASLFADESTYPDKFWKDEYCVQETAVTPSPGALDIRAKVEGTWQDYPLVSFPQSFWQWNKARRKEYLDVIRKMMDGSGSGAKPLLQGPHNGIVATYGAKRSDSGFALNNAIKGMGFLPREEKLPGIIKLLEDTIDESTLSKLDILDSLYANAEELFSPDRLASLELYSEPDFATQTFINQMLNPACVIVWMDIPTFKIKSIVRLLHPDDPALSKYEKDAIRYVNLVHSYFHGAYPKECITAIYYNVEVYDSSPGKSGGRGTRIGN